MKLYGRLICTPTMTSRPVPLCLAKRPILPLLTNKIFLYKNATLIFKLIRTAKVQEVSSWINFRNWQ
jgi:hypothetical protein